MRLDQWQVLYGSPDGERWLLLAGGAGYVPPDALDGLTALGEVDQVMRDVLNFRMRAMRRTTATPSLEHADRVRDTLARDIGISTNMLMYCVNGEGVPDMAAGSWTKLVKAYHEIS